MIPTWFSASRTDGFGKVLRDVKPDDTEKLAVMLRMRDAVKSGVQICRAFWHRSNEVDRVALIKRRCVRLKDAPSAARTDFREPTLEHLLFT